MKAYSVLAAVNHRLCRAASEPDKTGLEYLIHDKNHVLQHGQRFQPIDIAFVRHSKRAPVLWRGLDKYNMQQFKDANVNDLIVIPSYWSFSESHVVASSFARSYKTNTRLKLTGAEGFSLWQWALADLAALKKASPRDYAAEDGDFLARSYRDESEWLVNIGSRLRITKISEGLIECVHQ